MGFRYARHAPLHMPPSIEQPVLAGTRHHIKLRILLGGAAQWPESVGDEEAMEVYRQMCGRAACGADKCAKNYLVAIWKLRESVVGVCAAGGAAKGGA